MASSSPSPASSRTPAAARRGGRAARQSPFFRDLASPIPSHRGGSRFASPAAAAAPPSAAPPPPPLFTLDDRFAAADFSPDPTAADLLPVASSPSPRAGAGAGSRSPSWDRSRGKASAHGSPMDGVVEPPRKELLALPPPSSPCTPPPAATSAAAEAPSPVTPETEAARTEPAAPAREGKGDGEEWVTVFGFSLRDTNLVLREFEKCGVILRHHSGPREGNWIHILYQHSYDARKALQKNGIQLCSGVIIGVKHIDPVHRQQLDDRFTGINQGGFMVSLPSKSLVLKSSTGASNQLGALPRPYDPKSSTNVIRDAGRRTTGSVAAPAKSIVTNVMDLIFGI